MSSRIANAVQSKYETKRSGSLTARISFLGFKFPVFTGIHPGNVLSEEILRGAIEQRTQMLQTRGDFINHSASVEDGNDLLHTNIRPSQNQTIILDQILRQKTLELEDVELNTLCLQREINTLLRKYHEIIQTRKCKMDDVIFYRFMLSPIRLLPPEILVTIFQYAIETCAPLSEAWSPLGLSHVCRAWRNAILGCSKFWVELELNPSNLSQGSRRNHTPSLELFSNMIPAWLGRANGSRRLVLNIFFDDSVQGIHPHDFLQGVGLVAWRLTELLLLFRWREHGKFASPLLTLNTCFFPELEKLTLIEDHYPQEEAAQHPVPILVFGLCSKLRTLTLAACPRRFFEGARLQLPWSQLTCLELVRPISLQSLATVIFHCPQIQTLVIPELDAQSSDPLDFVLPSQRVPFPNLTTLKLNLRSDANPINDTGVLGIFSKLHLTGAKTVELSAGTDMHHFLFPLFICLENIHNSSISIRRLLLAHVSTNTSELISVFTACINLEELILYLPHFPSHEVLDCLRIPSEAEEYSKPLHSKLVSFTFGFQLQDVHDTNVFIKALLDLCKSWARDPLREQPLKALTLLGCSFNTSTAEPRIIPQIFREIRRRLQSLCLFHDSLTTRHVQHSTYFPTFLGLSRPFYNRAFHR
ncbi:hypothetical protein E4T56_gene12058 [Termitomyces sp. T112]|nr:hypothetical protein E4T56_gene12058 [Termitomyces sp. T112]